MLFTKIPVGSCAAVTGYSHGTPVFGPASCGATGAVSALSVGVGATNTVNPGTPAAVRNTGTPTAPVFSFDIPQGAAGSPGTPGQAGPQGVAGTPGAQGAIGPAGSAGAQGVQGNPGAAGSAGPQGAVGATGATGAQGNTGPAGPAPAGTGLVRVTNGVSGLSTAGSSTDPTSTAGDYATPGMVNAENTQRVAAISGEASTRASADTTNAQAASTAQAAAVQAHAGAPTYAVVNYATAADPNPCSSTYNISTGAYTGGADDTAVVQAAYNAAGLSVNPPLTYTFFGQNGNATQGTVVFPSQKICLVSSTISVPPGVSTQGYQTELHGTQTGSSSSPHSGDILSLTYNPNGGYGYGRFNDLVQGLKVTGPGVSTSYGYCIYADQTDHALFQFNETQGCKYGFLGSTMQYTLVLDNDFVNSQVNYYEDSDQTRTSNQPSIDNTIMRNNFAGATRYAMWLQSSTHDSFIDNDVNFAGTAPLLVGGQPSSFVSGLAISGGSGCTASSSLPATVTANTGNSLLPSAFIYTNSSGVPTGIRSTGGGANVTSATYTFAGCTTQPTVTPAYTNDQTATGIAALGEYQGQTIGIGDDTFFNLKGESSSAAQFNSGFAMLIGTAGTSGAVGNVSFYGPNFNNDSYSTGYFSRQMLVQNAVGIHVYDPAHYNLANPANSADVVGYTTLVNGLALDVAFGSSTVNETNAKAQFGDANGNYPANHVAYTAFASDGSLTIPSLNIGGVALINPTSSSTIGLYTGAWSNQPVAYNGNAIGSNIISGGRSALNWAYDTNGDGTYAVSEFGQLYGSDSKLHDAHYTCTAVTGIPASTYSPTGCIKDFDAGAGGTDVAGVEAIARGASIASAATITPITGFVHITGTAAISTITPPTNCTVTGYACTVKLLPDAAWTTATGGNIALASTAIVNKPLTMTYDNTAALWYPSY